jgi:hypothetical protein
MAFEVFTLKERPDLRSGIFAAAFRPPFFPEFMVHDPAGQLYFSAPFFDAYLEFAFAATDGGEIVARAFSVPFAFNMVASETWLELARRDSENIRILIQAARSIG